SQQMMGYWAQFARTGDPGRGPRDTEPAWLPWTDGPRYLILDTAADGGTGLWPAGVPPEAVTAAVDADPRLPTQRDKCGVFHSLASWSRGFTREQYPSAGAKGCADYPFDTFPRPRLRRWRRAGGAQGARWGRLGDVAP